MQYDPIKRSLGKVFNKHPFLRILFYKMLNLLLLRAWYIKKALKKWNRNAKNSPSVLDAGSGFGQYSWYISALNKESNILGVDVKEEQIADCNSFFTQLNRNQRVKFEYADLTALNKGAQFDLILSVDVMEHIEEDEKVFANFFAALRSKGVLLISTPSDQGGSDNHDHHEEGGFIDEHVRDGYSIEDMTLKLKRAGFSNIETKYTYGFWGSLSWKISMKAPIVILNKSKLFFIFLAFYYLALYPFAFIFNWIDTLSTNKTGTGLMVTAIKE